MKQKRHKPEEIIRLLREADSSDLNQEAFCRQKQISIATLHRWRKKYGAPDFIRSDNGPEFIGRSLGEWLKEQGIKTLYIDPGSPWQNGYVESFHDKFRRECLGREIFYTLTECWVVVNDWKRKYNQVRPHRSLRMLTPVEFAKNHSNRAKILPALRPTASTPVESCTTAPG